MVNWPCRGLEKLNEKIFQKFNSLILIKSEKGFYINENKYILNM